jgi:hypothetical protein
MLTNFIAKCARLIIVLIIHQSGKVLAIQAVDPILLKWFAVIKMFAIVSKAKRLRAHQPFVAPTD